MERPLRSFRFGQAAGFPASGVQDGGTGCWSVARPVPSSSYWPASAALAADASPGDVSAPSQQSQGATQTPAAPVVSALSASDERPWAVSSPLSAAGGLFRNDAISSRRMAGHPLEAGRSRHPGLAHRRRRSGHEPLRRPAPERPGGRTGRLAGSIRPAKEFGPDRRQRPHDAGQPLGPGRRYGRRHPRASAPQRSLRARKHTPPGGIGLESKAVRRPDRNHGGPPRVRRRGLQLPLRFHQSDLLPRAGRATWSATTSTTGRSASGPRSGNSILGPRAISRLAFSTRTRPISTPRPTPPFGQPRRRTRRASLFPPKSPGRQNSARFRGATRSEAGGTTARRRTSRPASTESQYWSQDFPHFPDTDATGFPPCCSSNSLTIPRMRTRRTA